MALLFEISNNATHGWKKIENNIGFLYYLYNFCIEGGYIIHHDICRILKPVNFMSVCLLPSYHPHLPLENQ